MHINKVNLFKRQVKVCVVPSLQVERFLAQLSEFATTNQISLGPLKSIMKSLLLVPNGELTLSSSKETVLLHEPPFS